MPPPLYFRYWAKADSAKDKNCYHLLPYHSLDVAAVGSAFLEEHPFFADLFSTALGLERERFTSLTRYFLALHDLGKFTRAFQAQVPELYRKLRSREPREDGHERHDNLGLLLWQEVLSEALAQAGLLPTTEVDPLLGGDDPWQNWMEAVTGHHGQPPNASSRKILSWYLDNPEDIEAATRFALDAGALLLSGPVENGEELGERIGRASWWLAGLTVLCDWLGSNRYYFRMHGDPVPLEAYWERVALPNARRAVRESGVLPAKGSPELSFSQLFRELDSFAPTPLQKLAGEVPLQSGPHLFIIEDVTGAGKTEAALTLVNRLMAGGSASGLYMALPTMATADAMYGRVGEVYHRLFDRDSHPSLVLAHGARRLNRDFRNSFERPPAEAAAYADGEEAASAFCTRWLADNKKKALLADCGVGTIDQALLAILYSRHQSLRLFGLTRKVLLVDEVHACDDYQLRLLETLISAHTAAGGSTILLSATLPAERRQKLSRAFREGMGLEAPTFERDDYPLLTHVGPFNREEYPVATRASVQREVKVRFVHSLDEAESYLVEVAKAGRCGCWIRNSVVDAAEAWRGLATVIPEDKLELFHARFALGDRLERERRVLRHFGKHSDAGIRAGRLVVATQVVEQSLDVDFDVLVTDLAPVDLLIQRAGRLQRHIRDSEGNPKLEGADGRSAPELVIVAPPGVDEPDAKWLEALLPRTQYVYPNHYHLWLTVLRLGKIGAIRMPEEARDLIEGVYGEEAEPHPPGLAKNYQEAVGSGLNKRGQALQNAIRLEDGYHRNSSRDWWEDTVTPTRLGDPSVTLRLARWNGDELEPWEQGVEDLGDAWRLSEVSVPLYWVGESPQAADAVQRKAIEKAREMMPDKGRWCVVVPMVPDDERRWLGTLNNKDGESVSLVYEESGLSRGKLR